MNRALSYIQSKGGKDCYCLDFASQEICWGIVADYKGYALCQGHRGRKYEAESNKELVGHTILGVSIDAEKQHYLVFHTNFGDVTYKAQGDCCSESWFYSVNGIKLLIGQKVLDTQYIEMGSIKDNRSRQQEDLLYCLKLKTNLGIADIEFRNSSNGYYGGWIEIIKELPKKVRLIDLEKDRRF